MPDDILDGPETAKEVGAQTADVSSYSISAQFPTKSRAHVAGDDLDGPKTVEETVTKASKITLLRQFSYGVIAYVVATALVVLLPIFVTSAPGEQAIKVVLVMQNVVLFGFMSGLAWIFRCGHTAPFGGSRIEGFYDSRAVA